MWFPCGCARSCPGECPQECRVPGRELLGDDRVRPETAPQLDETPVVLLDLERAGSARAVSSPGVCVGGGEGRRVPCWARTIPQGAESIVPASTSLFNAAPSLVGRPVSQTVFSERLAGSDPLQLKQEPLPISVARGIAWPVESRRLQASSIRGGGGVQGGDSSQQEGARRRPVSMQESPVEPEPFGGEVDGGLLKFGAAELQADVVILTEAAAAAKLAEEGATAREETEEGTADKTEGTTPRRGGEEEGEAQAAAQESSSEGSSSHSPRRELCKATAAVIVVSLLTAMPAVYVAELQRNFDAPTCTAHALVVERSCKPCGEGTVFLPLFGEFERSWPRPLSAPIYLIGLVWMFMGVGLACDQFMAAIEEITSTTWTTWHEVHPGNLQKRSRTVWNPTIANLTLMALGSSAPEILLSLIEVCTRGFFAGELGPSTIVGSAAFNLLMISAVCVSAIPAGDVRKIDDLGVFAVTATLSLFAYGWTVMVLKGITPNKVDIWEAVVTLAMFPILCVSAFAADKGCWGWPGRCCRTRKGRADAFCSGSSSGSLESSHGSERSPGGSRGPPEAHRSSSDSFLAPPLTQRQSRANCRATVMRSISGQGIGRERDAFLTKVSTVSSSFKRSAGSMIAPTLDEEPTYGFDRMEQKVSGRVSAVALKVIASHPQNVPTKLRYRTREGSAEEGVRYTRTEGVLFFAPGQVEHRLTVPICKGAGQGHGEFNENFTVELLDYEVNAKKTRIGQGTVTVTILSDESPGNLRFDANEVYTENGGQITLGVLRTQGDCGRISCRYNTVEDTARADEDFVHEEGTLDFEHGERFKTVRVLTLPVPALGRNPMREDRFKVQLTEASNGVMFDLGSGQEGSSVSCDVVIIGRRRLASTGQALRKWLRRETAQRYCSEWMDQFAAALLCNGSLEEQATAGPGDWVFHCIALFWKLLVAFVPPTCVCGGWACFIGALAMIGLMTAFVGDMASLLGCVVGLPDDVTAITLVALGTSLPDTFASKIAAQQDDTADNSVGNVTGSNSVNVFVGLGLPWTIAALYWDGKGATEEWRSHVHRGQPFSDLFEPTYPSGGFFVPADSLVFSVVVFTCCACACLTLLILRRRLHGGELGGPRSAQLRDSFFLAALWALYIVASVVNSVLSS